VFVPKGIAFPKQGLPFIDLPVERGNAFEGKWPTFGRSRGGDVRAPGFGQPAEQFFEFRRDIPGGGPFFVARGQTAIVAQMRHHTLQMARPA